jgi:uncharacterized membrane protein YvbJ
MNVICENCGQENRNGARVCSLCNESITNSQLKSYAPLHDPNAPPRKKDFKENATEMLGNAADKIVSTVDGVVEKFKK